MLTGGDRSGNRILESAMWRMSTPDSSLGRRRLMVEARSIALTQLGAADARAWR
jgi:hypothetical protein